MIRRVVGLSKRRPLLCEGLVSTSSRVIANASCAAGSSTGYDFCISPPEMPVATAASCIVPDRGAGDAPEATLAGKNHVCPKVASHRDRSQQRTLHRSRSDSGIKEDPARP